MSKYKITAVIYVDGVNSETDAVRTIEGASKMWRRFCYEYDESLCGSEIDTRIKFVDYAY